MGNELDLSAAEQRAWDDMTMLNLLSSLICPAAEEYRQCRSEESRSTLLLTGSRKEAIERILERSKRSKFYEREWEDGEADVFLAALQLSEEVLKERGKRKTA